MRTKKIRLFFLSFILISSISAQNNMENLDFSLIDSAPTYFSQLKLAKGWKKANTKATPDLYHKNGHETVGIPNNGAGTQEPYTGNSYAGIIAYSETSTTKYTEYIQSKFSTPLTEGKTYKISFRVSLADNSARAINGLGAYISKEAVHSEKGRFLIKATPQVVSNKVIENKTEWVEISGNFIATGGEQYITIGVFNAIDKLTTLSGVPDGINKTRAYYYIDGVSFADAILDTDKDGVLDKFDKCPKIKGPANNGGCPWGDADNDGILDNVDKCPQVKGIASREGCPAPISDEAKAKLDKFARAIYFNSGRSTFRPGVADNLDRIAVIMKEYDTANFSIEGHTDSAGASASNKALSDKRAKAVLDYLASHGISSSRLSSAGYGEEYPIADNSTSDGRSENRRVEIKLKE